MKQTINPGLVSRANGRFWGKVDVRGPDECWPWLAGRFSGKDYGKFCLGSRHIQAHRIAFYLANGRWPEPVARHTCDHGWCCNPGHIIEGTHAQNIADKIQRGRQAKGSLHGSAKLRERDVQIIRILLGIGIGPAEIGRQYGVAHATVGHIRRRETWAWVPDLDLLEMNFCD